jgi:hypothetical protein
LSANEGPVVARECRAIMLARSLSAAHRLKDLADVLELIRAAGLQDSLADRLDPSVRAKFAELWIAAQTRDDE